MEAKKRDFFISYTQKDKAWALWVVDVLERHGYSVYFQEADSTPGNDFVEFMKNASNNSGRLIAIYSEAYKKSYFCKEELYNYFANKGKFIIIKVQDCDVDFFHSHVYLEIFKYDKEDNALSKLLEAVGYIGKAKTRKPFPNSALVEPNIIADAFFKLGMAYLPMDGSIKFPDDDITLIGNIQEVSRYLQLSADFHHPIALRWMGAFYDGSICYSAEPPKLPVPVYTVDYEKAFDYYRTAARYGDIESMNKMGEIYLDETLVKKDSQKARDYFEKAIKGGSIKAKVNLANMYLSDLPEPNTNNKQRAWNLLKDAISMRSEDAKDEMDNLLQEDFEYFYYNYDNQDKPEISGTIQDSLGNDCFIFRTQIENELKFIRIKFSSKIPRALRRPSPPPLIKAKIIDYDADELVIILEAVL